jgi:integrase
VREMSPQLLEGFRADLAAEGAGPATQRRVLVMLQGVLQRGGRVGPDPLDPVHLVRKPPQRRTRAVRPLAPATVRAIRAELAECGDPAGATLVSVLAYAGLRPGVALALTWEWAHPSGGFTLAGLLLPCRDQQLTN